MTGSGNYGAGFVARTSIPDGLVRGCLKPSLMPLDLPV